MTQVGVSAFTLKTCLLLGNEALGLIWFLFNMFKGIPQTTGALLGY